ncbi:MAG: retroviral-like aspartic protease family protein [Defluviitaleaceae bacterium]|nr:retroviral-like aspartic protease family protein [Defluviitaleaceae bacterium]MCL2240073.1 retroviral-like aspartic protease family protein [Defluviitaleaceae bacterium]MCL2240288.1 retroviral-like aspartic protease family protein [Defluviitaleaceae bacterium]
MNKIGFSEFGRVYVPIDIKPINAVTMLPVRFKVDTGADTSTISKPELWRLGYDMDWIQKNAIVFEDKDKPTTAAGNKIDAGYVQLPLINIFEYEGKYWPFQIIMDEKQDFRNLLGRDLLAGFNYQFSNDDDIFSIKRTQIFKPRYRFLPNQEIHEVKL